jgi:hypothetical protein
VHDERGRCKRVNGFYSINYTRHQVDGALLRMPLISGGSVKAARPCRPRNRQGLWTPLFLVPALVHTEDLSWT